MVTTGTGLVLAIGAAPSSRIFMVTWKPSKMHQHAYRKRRFECVSWQNIEDAQARLDTAGTIFDMGTTMAVTGLLITAGGMTWGILKNRSKPCGRIGHNILAVL